MKIFSLLMALLVVFFCSAQSINGYKSLDEKLPVVFAGSYIIFKGDTMKLGPKAFFIDGGLSDAEAAKYHYVFNSVNKAAAKLTHGSEAEPMVLYTAPYVYWIDDPDDKATRVSNDGSTPYGLIINCEWLKFYGLTDKAENVVLACNRGQTIGAQGNFTMFKFVGQGTASENITFGNYCNVDLVYPLKPELSRPKRAAAIVQAQLIHCNGDKIVARNTRFISRLNLCPFVGGKRVLFDRCHFESTDDALCGTGVYLNSTLDFYSSKPFYRTTGTGAVFLNCDVRSFAGNKQYFTKAPGQVVVIDSRFTSTANGYWGWQDVVPLETRNYQYKVSLNGKALFIGKKDAVSTVDIFGKPVADAYRFVYKGKIVYNTYNLLRGDDDWDPMEVKTLVLEAERENKKIYTQLPVQLLISPTKLSVETGRNNVLLNASVMRFGNYASKGEKINWSIAAKDKAFVELRPSDDGSTCTVVPTNTTDETKQVVITARSFSGLEGASVVLVTPAILEAPAFKSLPTMGIMNDGTVNVSYALDAKYKDQSLVSWYRCTDDKGSNAIEVAVSRFDKPLLSYNLSMGDVGYYLMATVIPKHIRSRPGEAKAFVIKQAVAAKDVKAPVNFLFTDFRNTSLKNQSAIIPGFFTWGYPQTTGNDPRNIIDKDRDAWFYGEGLDGASGMFGLLQGRSASMRYTPFGERFGDMKLEMKVAPFKTAGQGFSVAHLYMDVLINFDNKTNSGYGLRFIRTTKYHDAVDCILVKYENGKVVNLTEPVTTTAFRTSCTIVLDAKDNKLVAHVSTSSPNAEERPNVLKEVHMETNIIPNAFGGFGIEYNGGSPTMINEMKVLWK
jgi:hypothetical protein